MSALPPRILVTDAHSTSALSVVRSLGARGLRVTAIGEEGRFNLAAHSRYVDRVVVWPSAERCPLVYVERLEHELRQARYDLLLPMTDTTVTVVRNCRARLEPLTRIALPSNDAMEAAQDKAATMKVAKQVGVAIPKTWMFSSEADVEHAAPGLTYPCVVKPRFSRRWNGGHALVRGTVQYADSATALKRMCAAACGGPASLIVQEFVAGTGIGVFALTDGGAPLAVFAHRRVREANPTGGRASLAESIAPEERLVTPALRILGALKWTGVAMIEFKDPGAPSSPVLMEVNGRFWGSLPLAVAAGVDFPMMVTQLMLGQAVDRPAPYHIGVRCRHLKGDISYLVAAFKGRPRHWRGPYPTRLSAVAAVAPWPGRWRSYNFRLDDPFPGLREAGDFVLREVMRFAAPRRVSEAG